MRQRRDSLILLLLFIIIIIQCVNKRITTMIEDNLHTVFPKDIASSQFACGCYLRNPQQLGLNYSKALVPLKHIDYQLEIINGLLHIHLSQDYYNPTQKFLAVDYSFPIDPKASIYKFATYFNNVVIQGIVKEREEARKEYEAAKKEGKQVALGELHKQAVDIMNLQIGNVPPQTEFRVQISFLQEIQISQNTFFRVHIPSTISPRYVQKFYSKENSQKEQSDVAINPKIGVKNMYNWSFKVTLRTTHKIIFWKSTSHQLTEISQNYQQNQLVLAMSESSQPNRDFIFLYTTENFEMPGFVVGKSDESTTLMLSFIPKFCKKNISDAFQASLANRKIQTDYNSSKGQYIFLIDRSGSMSGSRIKKARQSLVIFLKSLPIDSYFNIVSFGSSYSLMHPVSQKYEQEIVGDSILKVKKMGANYGGTQLYDPISFLLNGKVIDGYPKHIFVLTDGAVYNVQEIFDSIKAKTKYTRVHGIGIGDGASAQLIKGVAQAGKGKFMMISDIEDPTDRIIELLDETMSPLISEVRLEFNRQNVESIVPNPDKIPYILKNQIANFYITYNRPIMEPQMYKFQYIDSNTKLPYMSQILVNPSINSYGVVDKMSHLKVLKNLQKCAKDKDIALDQEMVYAKVFNYKQQAIKYSVKHQVLSQYTSFLCIGKDLVDGQYQEYVSKGTDRIQVPQTANNSSEYVIDKKPIQAPKDDSQFPKEEKKKIQPPPVQEQEDCCMGGLFGCGGCGGGCGGCGGGCGGTFAIQDQDSQIEVEQINMNEIQSANVAQIIEKQSVIGFWDQMDLIERIGKDKQILKQLCQEMDRKIILTKLVILWIEKYYAQKKYLLILRKSKDWLKEIISQMNIAEEKLQMVDCIKGQSKQGAKSKNKSKQNKREQQPQEEQQYDLGDVFA